MESQQHTTITLKSTIKAPISRVWVYWTEPEHIMQWGFASDDWHTPIAENDLRVGGKFLSRMEAKDGSQGFDFDGVYTQVELHRHIAYTLSDGRKVKIQFDPKANETAVIQSFETESSMPVEVQAAGWQAILDNFKKHAEALSTGQILYFEIRINAPANKVYQRMIDENDYADWTSFFAPGSHFRGSWKKGSKILFLAPDDKGNFGGMVSRIRENVAGSFVSIEHLGLVENEIEITEGPAVEAWAGGLENYTFIAENGHTLLMVDLDMNQEFEDYFAEIWPKALMRLKAICEAD
jgi:uncharacterized protein YndB with AHSA1/START domain